MKRIDERLRSQALKVYPGAPHGLTVTHKDQFNNDLLAFIQSWEIERGGIGAFIRSLPLRHFFKTPVVS